jgi:hypothetical protein
MWHEYLNGVLGRREKNKREIKIEKSIYVFGLMSFSLLPSKS